MFEYATSQGPGTLTDYGVGAASWMNHNIYTRGAVDFYANGDMSAQTDDGTDIMFCPAPDDCKTGK